MKDVIKIELSKFVDYPKTDWISGREFGEEKARELQILDKILDHQKFEIIIDENYVKAINDSFIKGFFSKVFENLKKKSTVESYFEITGPEYFKKLFNKNFIILEALQS